ncbi:MAG: low-specificity L-threonine aldolase [bacterium]
MARNSDGKSFVDLRSDTVTRPSPAMREAMFLAEVGDDVMGEDPSINQLQEYAADLCGVEAALFVPSGTMANQIAVRAWCRNGDEALVVPDSHVFLFEGGAAAGLSGVQLHPLPGKNGEFTVDDFRERIRPLHDSHFPETRLLWVENTHNRGGGSIVGIDKMAEVYELGREKGIPVHVDGARLCNAAVETGIPLSEWSKVCDSFSLCLSKGLGAPVGSLLLGSSDFIRRAHRVRKALGGGMRQAGMLAAAGMYALTNNIDRLIVDHERARTFAAELRHLPGLIVQSKVETNIVMIDIDPDFQLNAAQLSRSLGEREVKLNPVRPRRLRAVFHLDLEEDAVDRAVKAFREVLSSIY